MSMPATLGTAFDAERVRSEFPIFATLSRGKPLVYLDSAATAQKPLRVIEAISDYYARHNANIHRGVYQLSEQATLAWDAARQRVSTFIGSRNTDEVVFVRGTTEAINLVAQCFVRPRAAHGGTVVVTDMEHHANIVPWQLAGATTTPIPVTDAGELDLEAASRLLEARPILLAIVHVSNTLGTINPVAELCSLARQHGVPVLVDGAQAVPHLPVDVNELGCDFYCFSGHKLYGPTGIGVLWARAEHLEAMPPYQGGGDMIDEVRFDYTTFAPAPRKFEAGTPHIAGAVGLDAAIAWFESQDRDAIRSHESALHDYAIERLAGIAGLRVIGAAAQRAAVVPFTMTGAHPHDVASMLDGEGVCVRAGHHCTQPLHRCFGLDASVRASFAPYNTMHDVDVLVSGLEKVRRVFGA